MHAKEPLFRQENEEYYLNRFPKKAKTEGMYYYFQKVNGITVKTEVTKEQWSALYELSDGKNNSDLKCHGAPRSYNPNCWLVTSEWFGFTFYLK